MFEGDSSMICLTFRTFQTSFDGCDEVEVAIQRRRRHQLTFPEIGRRIAHARTAGPFLVFLNTLQTAGSNRAARAAIFGRVDMTGADVNIRGLARKKKKN